MRKALADEEDYVRSFAMMGIAHGMEKGFGTQEFRNEIFPSLESLLDRRDSSVGGEAPKLMLAIDEARALPVLLSPRYFTVDNREIHYILRALNASGQKVPHELLLPLLAAERERSGEYPHDYAYAEALRSYAIHPDAKTEATLRSDLDSANERIRVAAAESLAALCGVTDARDVVFTLADERGFAGMAPEQRHYLAVVLYDMEVNNGGHSQYFANTFGERWKDAIDGLVAIGSEERATILREAASLFGSDGPSEVRESRWNQLDKLDHGRLSALDTRYYACKDVVDVLLARYALENRERFASER
jgi:hypothetical protein